jgi:small subunit ribosomal protein S4
MRKIRKKTKRPRTPWDSTRIEEERKTLTDYGLRRKKEIRAAESVLRGYRRRARELIAVKNPAEEKILLDKLRTLGIITKESATVDDVLELKVANVLDRRLQTLVFRKGMARSVKAARQMIVHGHVAVSERRMRFPSYLVPAAQEKEIKAVQKGAGEAKEVKA